MTDYVPYQILTAAELNASIDGLTAGLASAVASIAAEPTARAAAIAAEATSRAAGDTALAAAAVVATALVASRIRLNVRDFGAKGDGSTDDTAAFLAAIAASTALTAVYVPGSTGRYVISASLILSASGIVIVGDGKFASQLAIATHTFDVFALSGGSQITIQDLGIVAFASTSTVVWAVNDLQSNGTFNLTVKNCYFSGVHSGINARGGLFRADNIFAQHFKPTDGSGIVITQSSTSGEQADIGDCWFENGPGQDAKVGLLLIDVSSCNVTKSQFIKMGNPIWASPNAGQSVLSLQLVNTWSDTSSGTGLVLDATTGLIARVNVTSGWFSSCARGIYVKGSVQGLMVHGSQIYGNSSQGIEVDAGVDMRGAVISGNQFAGNTGTAIDIGAGAGSFNIVGNSIGPSADFGANGAGIVIAAGASDAYVIVGNSIIANTGAALTDGGTGTTKYIANNAGVTTGQAGEFLSSTVASGSPVALTGGTAATITTLTLSAGEWDVSGSVWFNQSGGTITAMQAGVSTATGLLSADPSSGSRNSIIGSLTGSIVQVVPLAVCRFVLTTSTTIYLVGEITYSAGSAGGYGIMSARRVR